MSITWAGFMVQCNQQRIHTHNSQDLIELLKTIITKSIVFFLVGIFFFQFIIGQYIVNQLKSKQKKFWVIISLEINSNQVLKMIKYSKCPFI